MTSTPPPYMASPSLSLPSSSGVSHFTASSSASSVTDLCSSSASLTSFHDGCSDNPATDQPVAASLTAEELIRLFQCQICSRPLRDPIALPCGQSLCKSCLPQTYARKGISFPGTAARREGFACPYDECGREHARADCAPDVALENIMDQGRVEIEKKLQEGGGPLPHVADQLLVSAYSSAVSGDLKFNFGRSGFLGDAREKDFAVPTATADTAHDAASDDLVGNHDHDVGGAPKTATSFTVASGTTFSNPLHTAVAADAQDASAAYDGTPSVGAQSLMSSVIGAMRSEADCKVCYAIFDDPVTTACGHTYCRLCLQRSLDIHPSCPLCRRNLSANTYFRTESSPTNERLGLILETLWPEQVQSRRDVAKEEAVAREAEAQHDVPIFVCTVSLPTMPTVLHIFEPRYRLMIQRAMQGNRIFGMVLPRETIRSVEPNGNHSLPFAELGTLLRIKNVRMFPDGRSLVEATGMSRFRIVEHSMLDDYIVARVERYDDVSVADEEALEASQTVDWNFNRSPSPASITSTTSRSSSTSSGSLRSFMSTRSRLSSSASSSSSSSSSSSRFFSASSASSRALQTPTLQDIDIMPTASLIAYASSTMERKWRRFSVANRGPQPTDPLLLPWWLATVLPTQDVAKYRVLRAVSYRERFQICCRWLVELEEGSAVSGGCVVL